MAQIARPAPTVGIAGEKRSFGLWTLATGIVYGLQPDALFVVIPALALPSGAALAYVATFVAGTVAAMGGYTAVIGSPSVFSVVERNLVCIMQDAGVF